MNYNTPYFKKDKRVSINRKYKSPYRNIVPFLIFLLFAIIFVVLFFKGNIGSVSNINTKKLNSQKKEVNLTRISSTISLKEVFSIIGNNLTFLEYPKDTIDYKNQSLEIHYSIDTILQKQGKTFFKRYHPVYGAYAMIEPLTGKILSLFSYTREGEADIGNKLFGKSIFPAASIFKVITTAAVLEKSDLNSSSILKTKGSNYTLYKYQLEKELTNYSTKTLKKAFGSSVNPIFGRLGLYIIGAEGLNEYALKFGFNSPLPFEINSEKSIFVFPDSAFAIAEVACGFNQNTSISPIFGSMIAASVSNYGKMYGPTIIDSIINLNTGEKIHSRKNYLWRRPVKSNTATELMTLMKYVATNGTARKSFKYIKKSYRFKEIEYGGKTGSVDKDGLGKIDWFIGFCRHKTDSDQHIAVGVVTVHDDNWTVHSSFIGAEIMRKHIREVQNKKKKLLEQQSDSLSTES